MPTRISSPVWAAMAVLAIVATVLPIYLATVEQRRDPSSTLPPADRMRHELLDRALEQPGDAELQALYESLNAKHFGNDLPPIPVRWEPRLADVDRLEAGAATMKGMFGTKGDRAAILLSPSVEDDPAALQRALAHEMVHAYMFRMGENTAEHGPSFQAVLRRLAMEGAFEGLPSAPQERAALRNWIDQEKARLATEDAALRQSMDEARLDRVRADRERLNQEIARYNLMIVYPDGR
jgi:hypothetical protein